MLCMYANLPETLNIGNSRTMNRQFWWVWHQKMLTRHVVAVVAAVGGDDDDDAVIVAAVEWLPLTDYVVMIVANFAPNLAIHWMERIHYATLEMAAGIVVVIENNSFGLSLLKAHFS